MKSINLNIPAIQVRQRPPDLVNDKDFLNEYDFFIFSLSSDKLLQIAKFLSRKESPVGIQRMHKEDRDKEIGHFITSEHPFFPNNIIINVPFDYKEEFYNETKRELSLRLQERSAYVIDGQHRLKAFAAPYSKGIHMPLVVSAYFGLELPTIAEIFTRINYYQKPVSKSLVYDLLDFNLDPEFARYKEAHDIVSALNSSIGSPFYGLVKMLGIGSGLISQAAFVEALTTRYKILDILSSNKFDYKDLIRILDAYFSAVKESFPDKWGNEKSILTRSVGFNALVKVLRFILEKNSAKTALTKKVFVTYTNAMRAVNVDSDDIKTFGGFKGVNALADKFISKIDIETL